MRFSDLIRLCEDKTIAAVPHVRRAINKAAVATANATEPKPAKRKRKPAAKKTAKKTTKR